MRFRLIWKFHLIIDMVKVLKDIMALADFGEGCGLGAFPEPWERRLQSLQNRECVGIGHSMDRFVSGILLVLETIGIMRVLIFDHAFFHAF